MNMTNHDFEQSKQYAIKKLSDYASEFNKNTENAIFDIQRCKSPMEMVMILNSLKKRKMQEIGKMQEKIMKNKPKEGKKLKFEIINPSDKAFIEGSFKAVCLGTLLFGEGMYGLKQVDGDLEMPVFIIGGATSWFEKQFGECMGKAIDNKETRKEVVEALMSVKLAGERSSLNDFASKAHNIGERMRKKVEEE